MVILLFDIDGTLIQTGGAGGLALMTAFSDLFHVANPQEVPFSGRTDRGIARNLFCAHGIDDTTANWDRLRTEYLRRLPVCLPRQQGTVLPGIERLLDQMTARRDVAVGLLTGNARDGARLKLEHFRLGHHFQFGGFGDSHVDRDDVAHEALAASHDHVQEVVPPDRVWVIGDTPLDVRAARAIGAKVAAVATGWHTRDQLEDASPDGLLDDFAEPGTFLDQL